MKEHPILFSGPMVKALLDGRKTQTRRIAKFLPYRKGLNLNFTGLALGLYSRGQPLSGYVLCSRDGSGCWNDRTKPLQSPFGQPGDHLWVRETWRGVKGNIEYRADNPPNSLIPPFDPRFKPSIHMPRWASRITLEVESVRVERLQEISEADARAEGLEWVSPTFGISGLADSWNIDPRASYQALWESINGPGSWEANPYVWIVTFRRIA